mgnify:CR=1 FL=1
MLNRILLLAAIAVFIPQSLFATAIGKPMITGTVVSIEKDTVTLRQKKETFKVSKKDIMKEMVPIEGCPIVAFVDLNNPKDPKSSSLQTEPTEASMITLPQKKHGTLDAMPK